ncbi:hypothetical protein DNTS_006450 [Danionella cerebrum]|uniref:Protein Spindly n=1 Tax=Danionella cerebrum TaxID=2873325 RepID=A0A553N3Y6_9TELE|nr:hypothetical protein DNTS_006450 [Danionella translucida]
MSNLEHEILSLRQKLQDGEEALQRAGQYGLQLLDENMDMHNKLEEQRNEMSTVIEGLEQEKYSLQREVELKVRMLESLRSEFDLVVTMKTDLEEAQLAEKQMRHKLDQQTEVLNSKSEELRVLTERAHETMSSEILELQVQKMELESAMSMMEQDLQEAKYKEEQLNLANTTLQRHLERLTEEKEEREKETKAREVNQDLQIQLEQVLQQAQDPSSKGNSLFAEVEDKRAAMEQKLNSMKRQYDSLQKQHVLTKQHMHHMKIATLMQLQGNRADPAQLERLQFMLSDKNKEIESLMMKVRELEKNKMAVQDQQPSALSKEGELMDETYYTDLLKIQLANSTKEVEKMKEELSMARMKALSESQRVLELERKLYGTEQALKQRHSDNMKLQVKLEELKIKYTPNEVNKAQVLKRRREKFPLPEENAAPSKEESTPRDDSIETKTEKVLSDSAETPVMVPLQSEKLTEPKEAVSREGKSVRICEDPPLSIPRSPVNGTDDKNLQNSEGEEEENWKTERKRKKLQQPIQVSSQKTMATLLVKEGSAEQETLVEDENPEDLEVVRPTDKWQTLKPGQAVPAGSHVRLNLQTGHREVKLGQDEEASKYWRDGNSASFTAEELKEALKKFKDDHEQTKQVPEEDAVRAEFRPIEELKKDMETLDMLVETDVQVMKRLLTQFNKTNSTNQEKVTALLDLEYLVHQVDNAQNLVSMGGMQLVISALNNTDVHLQESAANPSVQVEAVEGGALQKLLMLLATQRPITVKKKVLFAVAALLRHFPFAQSHFLKLGGVQVLNELFQVPGAEALRELISQVGLDLIPDSSHQERLRQYAEVSLLPVLVEQGWCHRVPELLSSSEHDWREKALRTLLAMMAYCQTQFQQNSLLEASLSELQKQYQELVVTELDVGEQDGYFGEILALVDSVLVKMRQV